MVTRWNSYYLAFQRATKLQATYNLYAEHHINATAIKDAYAARHHNKPPDAPNLMRSNGLTAANCAIIIEYQDCLEPLKFAAERLEGRGKAGKFGAIYEVIPVMEYVLSSLETRTRPYSLVDFNVHAEAPEDHLAINLRAAWRKADEYYNKLDDSPVYYAAVCLHPYYKHYCDNSWADKADWLNAANVGFQRLWATYKPQRPRSSHSIKPLTNSIDDAISAYIHRGSYRDHTWANRLTA